MVPFYGIYYDKGGRESNEDSLLLLKMRVEGQDVVMAAVCDGMGGLARGEYASGYALECLREYFYRDLPYITAFGFHRASLHQSMLLTLHTVHEELRQFGRKNDFQCGTTMTLLLLFSKRYVVYQTGDSMAYALGRKGKALTQPQARGNSLTNCLGVGQFREPKITEGRRKERMAFLLTSDGFSHYLKPGDFYAALAPEAVRSEERARKVLQTLARGARQRGEKDNMSAIYLGAEYLSRRRGKLR